MPEHIIEIFNGLLGAIDDEVQKEIEKQSPSLTKTLADIRKLLWKNYKKKAGTSAGFYGLDEYIVVSAIKKYIEMINKGSLFSARPVEGSVDLYFFELIKAQKSILVYHATNLKQLGVAREHIFEKKETYRIPDITILKKNGSIYELIAAIEIKNYLDKSSVESGIKILRDIQDIDKKQTGKYALFSFDKLYIRDNQKREIEGFFDNHKCYLLAGSEQSQANADLSDFLNSLASALSL